MSNLKVDAASLMSLLSQLNPELLSVEQKALLESTKTQAESAEKQALLDKQKVILADKLNGIFTEYFNDKVDILDYKDVHIEYTYNKMDDSITLKKIVFIDELDEIHKIDVYVNVLFDKVIVDGKEITSTKYQKVYKANPFTPDIKLISLVNAINGDDTPEPVKTWFQGQITDKEMALIQEYKDIQNVINVFIESHSKIAMTEKYELDASIDIFSETSIDGAAWKFDINVNGIKKQSTGERTSRVKLNGYKNLREYALKSFIEPGCPYPSTVLRELHAKNGFNSQWNLSQHVSKHELSIPIEKRLYRQAKGL